MNLNEYLPLMAFGAILATPVTVLVVIVTKNILRENEHRRWLKIHKPTLFPAKLVESICRAMCRADGVNPDSKADSSTEGFSGQFTWELYKAEAAKFIAAYEVTHKYMEALNYDSK